MADGAPVRNLEAAVRQAHLDVNAVVASPIAAGLACLSDEERDLGVALVELGAAVTTVSLYAGGMLVEMASLPFGASDITDDIASAFGIRRSQHSGSRVSTARPRRARATITRSSSSTPARRRAAICRASPARSWWR